MEATNQAIKQYGNAERIAQWMDRVAIEHPTAFNIVLGILGIILAYQVLNYDFTTNI
jgi:hypothetical protein